MNRSPTNAEIEMLWVDAWNDLSDLIADRHDIRCLLPSGEIVDVEACKAWLQESAYSGFIPVATSGWISGKQGVIVSREPWS